MPCGSNDAPGAAQIEQKNEEHRCNADREESPKSEEGRAERPRSSRRPYPWPELAVGCPWLARAMVDSGRSCWSVEAAS